MKVEAIVRYTAEGFHCWKDAPAGREYLADRHRHLFHVEVAVEVFHDDREIEYHDLLEFSKSIFGFGEMGGMSCEMMAREIMRGLKSEYGEKRHMAVSVFEDGEVGSRLSFAPETSGLYG